ncbi:hypothetical protein [[Flexibacter] sp. ATCC 35208]|uniref:hypothetical protein n=1 Tax=[Flexibacter] sp. ATCC 35208 TaxID=1936242 RepID=UPI0009D2A91A|nr:hypothetical protein [[Flexibacter] sp. ATCC 35208]OMP75792.1 hypothetical protein BW716_28195 [[Flexibacter] sp. ATCC 35208]
MKHYPIIYRLSTLGLRQHQEFDYDFHEFRTDFIGESGSGKSMIADLLQLILVGSDAFESATAAMGGPRTPDGMVLKTRDGRGTDIGYAFLNIQIAASEFVVIGTYIQSSTRGAIPFTIQHGYDETTLIPLKQPLSYVELLQDDKVVPLDELVDYLETKELVCKPWQRRKQYHKFLYDHQLLELDLSENEKLLNDYATIIQSFSRGNTPETQKGDALKNFLFGAAGGKKIFASYQVTVADLREGFEQYAKNKSDIDLITHKQQRLGIILNLEIETEKAKYQSLLHDLQFTHQQKEHWNRELLEHGRITKTNYNSLLLLENVLKQLGDNSTIDLEVKQRAFDDAQREYGIQQRRKGIIESVDSWLKKYDTTIGELLSVYQKNARLKKYADIWKEGNRALERKGLQDLLTSLMPSTSARALIETLDDIIARTQDAIKEKEGFQQFMDINNTGSLGHWALKQKRAFNLKEESVIMHFKTLSTHKPGTIKPFVRYIPAPEILFRELSITESDDVGGWLHLNGIREHIHWVKKQILSKENIQHIEQFFQQETQNIKEQIQHLEREVQIHKQLKSIVIELDFDSYLQAISILDELKHLNVDDDFMKQSEAIVKDYIEDYEDKENILRDFEDSKLKMEETFQEKEAARGFNGFVSTKLKVLNTTLRGESWKDEYRDVLEMVLPTSEQELVLANQQQSYLMLELTQKKDKASFLEEKIEFYRTGLNTFKFMDAWDKFKVAEDSYQTAHSFYVKAYGDIPADVFEDKTYKQEGSHLRIDYQNRKYEFEHEYNAAVHDFIKNDAYQYENIFDTTGLSKVMLPGAFPGLEVNNKNIIELISNLLDKINEKNRDLNRRKFQRISDLLDQVLDEVQTRLSMVKRIDIFLNKEDKEITGGHRVRLQSSMSREYPDEWITNFQALLRDDNENLIDTRLAESPSLDDKLLAAFGACSGSRTKPKIEKILDPNSYFDLEFTMKSESGAVNKGSSGQSYAGIALLCIARLHIIGAGVGARGRNGIKFMPVDEAEGLGSNYDMLYNIAKEYHYQIVSFAINPLGAFTEGNLYMYMLSKDLTSKEDINYIPLAIRCERDMDLVK